MRFNQIIEVEWDDIVTHPQWIPQDKAEKELPCRCKSVGYFLNQDKHVLRLSCTIQPDESKPDRDLTIIPRGCITKIIKIK